jgi:acyl-homoserine lactone acylase PvdQ
LDQTEHAWWRRGMLSALRNDHRTSGAGREETLASAIETLAGTLEEKYGRPPLGWLGDDNVRTSVSSADLSHVRQACRVLATHKVLSPFVTDETKLLQNLRERNGEEQMARKILQTGVASALWMSKDPALTASRMVRAMAYDHGSLGWAWEETKKNTDADATALEVRTRKCLYHAIFSAENVPHLATTTCCSVDGVPWFPNQGEKFHINVTRLKALSQGDDACVLRVERVGK